MGNCLHSHVSSPNGMVRVPNRNGISTRHGDPAKVTYHLPAQQLSNMATFEIPDGLGELLKEFTVAVLRERPDNIYDYSVEYFTKVRDTYKAQSVPMYIIVDDDDEAGEPDPVLLKKKNKDNYGRRNSVSAERYNPEEDDDEEERTVYPKTDEQRERLVQAVGGILLFRSLDSDQVQEVIDAMFEKKVEPGDVVIQQGDDGDNFYVVDTGVYDVLVVINGENKKVHQFDNKGSFGELALMYNMPRSATIEAVSEGTLWAMDRNSFRRIVVKSAFKKRKMYEKILETVPMLESLSDYERMNLADALTPKLFQPDDRIITEGDDADGMYFIEDGVARVTIRKGGAEKEVSKMSKGKYFGEMALVEQKPRSANVYAESKVKVAFLDREAFERLLGPCLDIMKREMEGYQRTS